jgi:hypothetical protein
MIPRKACGTQSPTAHDRTAILRTLHILAEPDQVLELRALDASTVGYRPPHTEAGYFNDPATLADAAAGLCRTKGIYVSLNPMKPALLARAFNRLKPAYSGDSTADHDIVRRRWLPIDCDPVRPSGISATDAEHAAGLERARSIRDSLRAEGWPDPVEADGANSGHVLYRIDLPNDDESRILVQRCLQELSLLFNDEAVSIDQANFNAARIWKLYGTMARKGDNIPDRPHGLSRLLHAPEVIIPVPRVLLEALARAVSQLESPHQTRRPRHRQAFDLDRWIAEHNLDVLAPTPWRQRNRKWIFRVCPWNSEHTNRAAYIIQFADGAIAAGCHHHGCQGHDWLALRDLVEPGWRRDRQRVWSPRQGVSGGGNQTVHAREVYGWRG